MAPKPPHARIVPGSQGSSEFAAVITTSGRAVSCSSHPHLSQHRAAASTSTKFGVDLPNSVYSDGTLIYENTILTKIYVYAHVLAWSTSTLVVIIVADTGEWTPATMSDIGRGEP